MEKDYTEEKPRLIECGQGFSLLNTVEYKNRLLYSKYSPDKAVKDLVAKTDILDGSFILINSPLLFYGLKELREKCGKNSVIVALEGDDNLLEFSKNIIKKENIDISIYGKQDLEKLDFYAREIVKEGQIKRCISLNFSASSAFSSSFYSFVKDGIQEIITFFWKNRITLGKFSKIYYKNIFLNLPKLENKNCLTLDEISEKISKPILVLGAGESLESLVKSLKNNWSDFFSIAVDAALPVLKTCNLIPSALVGMECQNAVEKFYIGENFKNTVFFASLSSRPQIIDSFISKNKKIFFFESRFDESPVLFEIEKNVMQNSVFSPLGSVGLAATVIALKIRQNPAIPVFISGLDFSFTCGRTHSRESSAYKTRLFSCRKTNPIDNIKAAFENGVHEIKGINEKSVRTSKVLENYALVFRQFFSSEKNIFDIRGQGIDLGLSIKSFDYAKKTAEDFREIPASEEEFLNEEKDKKSEWIFSFLKNEKEDLKKLKSLMSEGEKSLFHEKEKKLSEEIKNIAESKTYLFSHFPDGFKFKNEESFLKRIRAETEYFLKYL